VSKTFAKLSQCVPALDDTDLQNLEKFVVALRDRSSAATRVNDARLNLHTTLYRPLSLLSGYMQSALSSKEEVFGVRELSPGLAPIVQRNGDGSEKTTLGRYAGLTFHQLLQVVKNLLNVVTRETVPRDANAFALE